MLRNFRINRGKDKAKPPLGLHEWIKCDHARVRDTSTFPQIKEHLRGKKVLGTVSYKIIFDLVILKCRFIRTCGRYIWHALKKRDLSG